MWKLASFILVTSFLANAVPCNECVMPLSSLKPGCILEKRWMGLVPAFPWGIWLKCDYTSFLVTHPKNLFCHVEIKTPEEALEFVRFFSNAESYDSFELDGMVEVLPKNEKREIDFNELEEAIFLKHFKLATVRVLPPNEKPSSGKEEGCCRGREFSVQRTVLLPDNTVCEVVELVCDDGYYNITSKKILLKLKNVWLIGLQHFMKKP